MSYQKNEEEKNNDDNKTLSKATQNEKKRRGKNNVKIITFCLRRRFKWILEVEANFKSSVRKSL